MLGHDLGTVLILGAIVAGVLFAAGYPAALVRASSAFRSSLMAIAFVVTSPNRLGRFDVWLGRDTDEFGAARQPIHGRYALADGGWFGLGLGASREKWGLLSEPHNDFIFAIIGEELGLPGTIAILLLFAGLALACYRLVTRTDDLFVRIATAGIMTWIIVQAADQHRRRHRPAARHRRAAAARLLGWVVAHHEHVRPRHPAVLRARRTRVCRGAVGAALGPAPVARGDPRRRPHAPDALMTPGGPPVGAPRRGRHGRARLAAARPGRLPAPPRPRRGGHRAGHRRRARGPPRARARVPAARGAEGALPASALRRPAPPAGQPAPRGAGRRGRHRQHRRRGRRRLRRLRLDPGLPRGPAPRHAGRGPRAERPARPRQPARRPVRRRRRCHLPRHPPAARHGHGDAVAPRDRDARPGRPPGRGARPVRAHRRPDGARHRRLARGPAPQRGLRRCGRRRCRRPGVQVLHVAGTGKEFVPTR